MPELIEFRVFATTNDCSISFILELQHTKESQMTKQIINERIVQISLEHYILSPCTAFIGIEKRVDTSNTDMVLREGLIEISTDN